MSSDPIKSSIKLRGLSLFAPPTSDNTTSSVSYNFNNFAIKPPPAISEQVAVNKANAYNPALTEGKRIPTALEFVQNKLYYTPEEYDKVYNDIKIKRGRNLAAVHEFLFDLSYMPFINIPLKGFDS